MRTHLFATSIAFSLSLILLGVTASAMTSDQANALAKTVLLHKDASAIAKLSAAAVAGDANAQNSLGSIYYLVAPEKLATL